MKRTLLCALLAVVLAARSGTGAGKADDLNKPSIPFEQAQVFFKTQQMLDDKNTNFNRRLILMFGKQKAYKPAQISAVLDPKYSTPPNPDLRATQKGPPPRDTFARADLDKRYATLDQLDPTNKGAEQRLIRRGGPQPQDYYRAEQVRDAEKRKDDKPPTPEQAARTAAIDAQREAGEKNIAKGKNGLRAPRIRHDWTDVLYDEDASQAANGNKALGDLTGAQFSYAHDGIKDADAWTVHGAVIVPYTKTFEHDASFSLRAFALAPSATFDRVTTASSTTMKTDTVLYRLGVYADFFGFNGKTDYTTPATTPEEVARRLQDIGSPFGVQLRAAGVYVTDFQHEDQLGGYEVDIEPRFIFPDFKLGFQQTIIPKVPLKADASDSVFLECQLRTWLHLEGGDAQDTGAAWTTAHGTFLRLGPSVQFSLRLPSLPGGRSASVTSVYNYLPDVIGSSSHRWYTRTTVAYDLFRDTELNHKVSITADYQRGGLTFTKAEVDQFTLGLGVLF